MSYLKEPMFWVAVVVVALVVNYVYKMVMHQKGKLV